MFIELAFVLEVISSKETTQQYDIQKTILYNIKNMITLLAQTVNGKRQLFLFYFLFIPLIYSCSLFVCSIERIVATYHI